MRFGKFSENVSFVEFLQNFRNIQVRFDESLQRTDFSAIMGKIGKIWAKFWKNFNLVTITFFNNRKT